MIWIGELCDLMLYVCWFGSSWLCILVSLVYLEKVGVLMCVVDFVNYMLFGFV